MTLDTTMKYNKVMGNYSKNTGGGSSDQSQIMLWQERDEVIFANCDDKVNNSIYLTIVHMWSQLYDDPLVVVKDDIPPKCQIEDTGVHMISRGDVGCDQIHILVLVQM